MSNSGDEYYDMFLAIVQGKRTIKLTVDEYYKKHGNLFLVDFPKRVKGFHDVAFFVKDKKEIERYCKRKLILENNWFLKDDYKNIKYLIGTVLVVAGLIISYLKL